MKHFRIGAAFALAALLLTNCTVHFQSPGPAKDFDILTPEQRLRSELGRTWLSCRTAGKNSTLLVLDSNSNPMKLAAHVYPTATCTGTSYESYQVAEYNYTLAVTDAHHGSATVHLVTYYPNHLPIEDGFVQFSGSLVESAVASVTLNPDFSRLHLDIARIQTGAQAKELTAVTKLDFQSGKAPKNQYAGLILDGTSDSTTFPSQPELIQHLESLKAIDPECIADYFSGRPYPLDAEARAFVKDAKVHADLERKGKSTSQYDLFDVELENKKPYLMFVLFYGKDNVDDESSTVLCPLIVRPGGEIF